MAGREEGKERKSRKSYDKVVNGEGEKILLKKLGGLLGIGTQREIGRDK